MYYILYNGHMERVKHMQGDNGTHFQMVSPENIHVACKIVDTNRCVTNEKQEQEREVQNQLSFSPPHSWPIMVWSLQYVNDGFRKWQKWLDTAPLIPDRHRQGVVVRRRFSAVFCFFWNSWSLVLFICFSSFLWTYTVHVNGPHCFGKRNLSHKIQMVNAESSWPAASYQQCVLL